MFKTMKKFVKTILDRTEDHWDVILMGLGITGMISCAYSTGVATRDAILVLNEKSCVEHREDFTVKEKIEACWKCYIPAVVLGGISTACLIGSNRVQARRSAALATAYNLSEKALKEYREKTKSLVGDAGEKTIRDALAKDEIEKNPIKPDTVYLTGSGDTLCYDPITCRYFKSDRETIRKVVNDLNEKLINDDYLALNELYYALDLPESSIGNNLGWDIEKGKIDMRFSSQIALTGEPCLVLDYMVNPKWAPGGY